VPAWVWPKKKCARHIRDRSPHTELDSRHEDARAFMNKVSTKTNSRSVILIDEIADSRISKNSKIYVIATLCFKMCRNLEKI